MHIKVHMLHFGAWKIVAKFSGPENVLFLK